MSIIKIKPMANSNVHAVMTPRRGTNLTRCSMSLLMDPALPGRRNLNRRILSKDSNVMFGNEKCGATKITSEEWMLR